MTYGKVAFRVPYLVRWPGHVPAGTVCDEMLNVVDTLATIAAVVGESLPAQSVGAEDSYNMLPAWLDQQYSKPIRPDMIVHSADGTFAIRRGPYKWIEGIYHPDTKAAAVKAHQDQFHRQLYDLKNDIGETKDVSNEHPEIAAELADSLDRYRNALFSRNQTATSQK